MVPVPQFESWDAFNAHLEEQCRKRQRDVLRGERESIGARLDLNYLWISVATRAERKRHTVHLTNLDVLPRCLSPEFYRRVISVTPLLPRPDVVAHAWVIE